MKFIKYFFLLIIIFSFGCDKPNIYEDENLELHCYSDNVSEVIFEGRLAETEFCYTKEEGYKANFGFSNSFYTSEPTVNTGELPGSSIRRVWYFSKGVGAEQYDTKVSIRSPSSVNSEDLLEIVVNNLKVGNLEINSKKPDENFEISFGYSNLLTSSLLCEQKEGNFLRINSILEEKLNEDQNIYTVEFEFQVDIYDYKGNSDELYSDFYGIFTTSFIL